MNYYSTDPFFYDEMLIAIIAVTIAVFMVVAVFVSIYVQFKKERDYIKMEMSRSYEEEEYLYWKRELRRLYLSHIPIIGIFFR